MITKETKIDKIEITESGYVHVRERTDIIEDDKVISKQNHRYVIDPPEGKNKVTTEVNGYKITVEKL
jgi:hypothetical protein